MGFEEIPHTADWALRVWSDSLGGLLVEAARGMSVLSGAESGEGPRERRIFEAEGLDKESLLVSFLTELVFYAEQENLVFDYFEIDFNGDRLSVVMEGVPLKSLSRSIKAVTFHNLTIKQSERGLETVIVFDV